MAARGLKTKIAFNVAFLLLLSALITDILVVVVIQNVMVKDLIADVEDLMTSHGSDYLAPHHDGDPLSPAAVDLKNRLQHGIWKNASLMIWDAQGDLVFQHQNSSYPVSILDHQFNAALFRRGSHAEEAGITWAVFWWHAETVALYMPIQQDAKPMGFVVAQVPLAPVYDKLRSYNKPIFLYIVINTAILTIVGLYRIFRLYLRPIDRIVRQADDFQDDSDLLFAFRQEDNELNRLSMSLNQMLTRISSDKEKLRHSVASLERANQELQNAQQEIIRAEKLASVGRLAAGIAHEIGNPIGIVLGYLDMLKDNDLNDEDKADFLERTEKEVQRINTVIRQLLNLARPQASSSQHVQLHDVLHDIVEVMRLQPILKEIQLELDLQADCDEIQGNQDQLRQVFLNLMLNATDAIRSKNPPAQGRIQISTQNAEDHDPDGRPCLQIRFADNGMGIDPQQLENIFDPFYTTKEPGKGTGLGLSVSYMIVEAIGGHLKAENRSPHGAVFTITLPMSDEKVHHADSSPNP